MSHNERRMLPRRGSLEARLYLAAALFLCAGIVGGIVIYALAPAPDTAAQFYGMANSPQYVQQLQQIGGTAEVALAGFHQWFDSLWHGKPLAYTVAVLCIAAAVACFLAGHFIFFDAPSNHNDESKH